MTFDIRLPIGIMFSVLGLLLTVFGLVSDDELYNVSLGININLVWGLVLLGFGIFMLIMGLRGSMQVRAKSAAQSNQ